MPTDAGWLVGGPDYSQQADFHHWCDRWIPLADKDEHARTCGARPSLSLMEWEVVQERLLRPDGMRNLLLENDRDATATAYEVGVLTGFRWLPGPEMVLTIAGESR